MISALIRNGLALIVENFFGRMASMFRMVRIYPEIEAFCLAPIMKSSIYTAVLSSNGSTVETITSPFPYHGYLIVAMSKVQCRRGELN